jgi:tetratricopeptide (TPR) repeat protein
MKTWVSQFLTNKLLHITDEKELDPKEEEVEEYKQQANFFKEQGNAAFQKGDTEGAVKFFSQAISVDPDNYLVYSNRSAAYMTLNHVSKALHDAEICVQMAPNWAKGYSRLGTAQQGLKRFEAAMDSFKKGIQLDPNNAGLWSALKSCERAAEQDKQERFARAELERKKEEDRLKRMEEAKKQMSEQKQQKEEASLNDFFDDLSALKSKNEDDKEETTDLPKAPPKEYHITKEQEEEDDLLASFFTEVSNPTSATSAPTKAKSSASLFSEDAGTANGNDDEEENKEDNKKLLTEKYTKQHLGSSKEIVQRLTGEFHQWKNLNPFAVFDLDIDATEEDIKFRYKKLSLKVHPDRLRNMEHAREAFEQVKEAYEKLMDPDQRKTTIAHTENVTEDLQKERKRTLHNTPGMTEAMLPDYEEERKKALFKHFASKRIKNTFLLFCKCLSSLFLFRCRADEKIE